MFREMDRIEVASAPYGTHPFARRRTKCRRQFEHPGTKIERLEGQCSDDLLFVREMVVQRSLSVLHLGSQAFHAEGLVSVGDQDRSGESENLLFSILYFALFSRQGFHV